jgi:predicted secreted protein
MAGLAAFGTMLKIGDASTGVEVANVTSIEGPGLSTETIDVTAHDSAGDTREEVPTFKSGGEVTLRINYDPAETTHKNAAGGLLKLWSDKTLSEFTIVYPTTPATNVEFSGYVTAFAPSAPFDGKIEANVTIKVAGAVTMP